jgi:hypothetical protein
MKLKFNESQVFLIVSFFTPAGDFPFLFYQIFAAGDFVNYLNLWISRLSGLRQKIMSDCSGRRLIIKLRCAETGPLKNPLDSQKINCNIQHKISFPLQHETI